MMTVIVCGVAVRAESGGVVPSADEEACEAVDEAMVRAFERWRKLRDYENPAGWVYRVGLNWATSALRRRRRLSPWRRSDSAAAEPLIPDPDIERALKSLQPGHRAVIVLRYYLDWAVADIAVALDIPAGTVKSRIHRGLAQLRIAVEGEA